MSISEKNLIWIDLEMTGLDTDQDYIIEIATIITDQDLRILAEGPMIAIHQPDDVLEGMDEWNTNQHGNSGLTERVQKSSYTVEQAEQATLEFLKQYVPEVRFTHVWKYHLSGSAFYASTNARAGTLFSLSTY